MQQPSIVLTADESVMSDFRKHIYNGYAACFPQNFFTKSFFKKLCPPVECHHNGRVKLAPTSLRIVEAILCRCGFSENDYAIVHPAYLDHFIGRETKIIGISAIDPRGLGPISTTIHSLIGGTPYSRVLFASLLKQLKPLKEKYSLTIVAGGPGAWQLADEKILDKFGIDYLVVGEAENIIPKLFVKLIHNKNVHSSRIITGKAPNAEEIPAILHPTTNGLIEVSRRCGRGCKWCSSSFAGAMRCIPIDTIKKSAEVNVKSNITDISLQSDDILLYGSKPGKFVPDQDALLMLLNELYSIKGIRNVSFLHFSFASIVANPDILPKITNLLKKRGCTSFEVQIGIESGSPHLIERYMPGKALPFSPYEWPNIVKEAAHILKENGWFCYATLIIGLPGESSEDIRYTAKLVRELKGHPIVIIPLLFTPLTPLGEPKHPSYKRIIKKNALLFHEVLKHNQLASQYRNFSPFIIDYLNKLLQYVPFS
jgi:radical SAM superfamily enzyme YgiQ (UPF0313 family)